MIRVVFSRMKICFNRLICVIVALLTFFSVFGGAQKSESEWTALACSSTSKYEVCARPSLWDIIKSFFGAKEKAKNEVTTAGQSVYVGGYPLGFTLECEGVIVIAVGSVQTAFGDTRPCEGKNIKVGDIIFSVNGKNITSAMDMEKILSESNGEPVKVGVRRNEEKFFEIVTPSLEASTSSYRLGIWIRDNAAGVGTLTYIREDNLRFGALGHPVTDIDTDVVLPVAGGGIYKCSIVGVNKGTRGTAGELRGLFLRNGEEAGSIDKNTDFGVFGKVKQEYIERNQIERKMEVASRDSVRTGKATILTTVDGAKPEEFDIEIIKLVNQTTSNNKSMVIRVVDERLIEKTGGIVQGMSGSPIIQNGKLVGAITHVFVSDPTKGFGVYIDWMIDN